jgi:hypothetical protein
MELLIILDAGISLLSGDDGDDVLKRGLFIDPISQAVFLIR